MATSSLLQAFQSSLPQEPRGAEEGDDVVQGVLRRRFSSFRLKESLSTSEQITELTLELKRKEGHIKKLQEGVRQQYNEKQELNVQYSRLQHEVERLHREYGQAFLTHTLGQQTKPRSEEKPLDLEAGKERFELEKKLQVAAQQHKKRVQQDRARLRELTARYEQTLMQYEDEYAPDSVMALLNTLQYEKAEAKRAREFQDKQDKERMEQRLFSGPLARRGSQAQTLDFNQKLSITTPEDQYITFHVEHSSFAESLGTLKTEALGALKELKQMTDKTLASLWNICHERTSRNPRDDFYKETRTLLAKSRQFLFDFARKLNLNVKAVVDREKCVKEELDQAARLRYTPPEITSADVECTAELPSQATVALEEKIRQLQRSLHTTKDEANQREAQLKRAITRLQNQQFDSTASWYKMHRQLFGTLHSIYTHRCRFVDRLPDPARVLQRPNETVEEAFYKNHMQIVEEDLTLLRRLQAFMLSTEMLGLMPIEKIEHKIQRRMTMIAMDGEGAEGTNVPVTPCRPPQRRPSGPLRPLIPSPQMSDGGRGATPTKPALTSPSGAPDLGAPLRSSLPAAALPGPGSPWGRTLPDTASGEIEPLPPPGDVDGETPETAPEPGSDEEEEPVDMLLPGKPRRRRSIRRRGSSVTCNTKRRGSGSKSARGGSAGGDLHPEGFAVEGRRASKPTVRTERSASLAHPVPPAETGRSRGRAFSYIWSGEEGGMSAVGAAIDVNGRCHSNIG